MSLSSTQSFRLLCVFVWIEDIDILWTSPGIFIWMATGRSILQLFFSGPFPKPGVWQNHLFRHSFCLTMCIVFWHLCLVIRSDTCGSVYNACSYRDRLWINYKQAGAVPGSTLCLGSPYGLFPQFGTVATFPINPATHPHTRPPTPEQVPEQVKTSCRG